MGGYTPKNHIIIFYGVKNKQLEVGLCVFVCIYGAKSLCSELMIHCYFRDLRIINKGDKQIVREFRYLGSQQDPQSSWNSSFLRALDFFSLIIKQAKPAHSYPIDNGTSTASEDSSSLQRKINTKSTGKEGTDPGQKEKSQLLLSPESSPESGEPWCMGSSGSSVVSGLLGLFQIVAESKVLEITVGRH